MTQSEKTGLRGSPFEKVASAPTNQTTRHVTATSSSGPPFLDRKVEGKMREGKKGQRRNKNQGTRKKHAPSDGGKTGPLAGFFFRSFAGCSGCPPDKLRYRIRCCYPVTFETTSRWSKKTDSLSGDNMLAVAAFTFLAVASGCAAADGSVGKPNSVRNSRLSGERIVGKAVCLPLAVAVASPPF